jgi:hypothetical protein
LLLRRQRAMVASLQRTSRQQWLHRALGNHPAGGGRVPALREVSIEDAISERTSMPAAAISSSSQMRGGGWGCTAREIAECL